MTPLPSSCQAIFLKLRAVALITLGAFLLAITAFAPAASADFDFGEEGSDAGQLNNPHGIAVDRTNGRVYVTDTDNYRVDVFDESGEFEMAFGWGVADGEAELQSCGPKATLPTLSCRQGLSGGGAGEFSSALSDIAIDNDPLSSSQHDVYVLDGQRVQKFDPDGNFLLTWGGGVISGGATGTGNLTDGSTQVTNVKTSAKTFYVGQTLASAGKIAAETKIVAVGPGTITLSKPAIGSGPSAPLSVAEGPGNIPVNEVVVLVNTHASGLGSPNVGVITPNPSPSKAEVGQINPNANATELQQALEGLPNVGPGNVEVIDEEIKGEVHSYTIEFKGPRFADTDVTFESTSGSGRREIFTEQNGGGAKEICPLAIAASCSGGIAGSGEGQFFASSHLATGPGGKVYVASFTERQPSSSRVKRIQIFEPSGAFSSQFETGVFSNALAVDSAGNSYIASDSSDGHKLRKFSPSGAPLAVFEPNVDSGGVNEIRAIAVDATDNVLVFAGGGGIVEYNAAGVIQRVFYNALENGLAPYHSAAGELFSLSTSADKVRYSAFPPPGPIAVQASATAVGNLKATFNTSLNPEGKSTTYHFQYVDQAGFQSGGFSNPATKATPESAPIGSDFKLHPQAFKAAGLTPETTYHLRAVATNSDGASTSPEAIFKTKPALEFGNTYATEVGADSARLHAEVNPLGISASGHFQYVEDAAYQVSGFAEAIDLPDVGAGAAPIDLGSSETLKTAAVQLSPLPPGATYHYRFIATDSFGTFTGPEHAFTTLTVSPAPGPDPCPNAQLRSGPAAALPDCRAYEMVSPLDKANGEIAIGKLSGPLAPGRLEQSSSTGQELTYSSYRAFPGSQGAPYGSQYLARRGASGWATEAISPAQQGEVFQRGADLDTFYKFFSPDFSESWFITDNEPVLAPGARAGSLNLYRRDNTSGGYEACTTAEPEVPPNPVEALLPELQGVTADGRLAVFTLREKLLPEASPYKDQLYACAFQEGQPRALRLVSVLPDGSASKGDARAGSGNLLGDQYFGRRSTTFHALSNDGSRVFWTAGLGPGPIYVRENPSREQSALVNGDECTEAAKACTLAVSGSVSEKPSRFMLASADGSKVAFTVEGQFYEFDVDTQTPTLIASQVDGVAGASEDASRIYFVSAEALAPGATPGAPNLYLRRAGAATFIATLAEADIGNDNTTFSIDNAMPLNRVSRVSPDGLHLAFLSSASLTGYDNRDANSGQPDTELYLYDADTGHLACVSCDRSGARPIGRQSSMELAVKPFWAAAQIPGWQRSLYAGRPLADDGNRLFFESYGPLVLTDTNGKADVYQWEAPGSGDCTGQSPAYSPANDGCISLISSGTGSSDSRFVDASADGSDVFFATASSLLPQDPGLIDIYDARAGGGYPPPPAQPSACEGEACQGSPSPPDDPTPASSAFVGAGNVPEKESLCRRGRVRRKGRCVPKRKRKPAKHSHHRPVGRDSRGAK